MRSPASPVIALIRSTELGKAELVVHRDGRTEIVPLSLAALLNLNGKIAEILSSWPDLSS